jgi:transposase
VFIDATYRGRTDMRKGVDSLCGMIRNELGKDPLSGELFVFFNRGHSLVKILMWDQDSFSPISIYSGNLNLFKSKTNR